MRRDVFQAIADPIRREIIEMLSGEAMTVNEVAMRFEVSRPAISKHLKILGECGLIEVQQKGRERYCRIKPKSLIPAYMWLDQYKGIWEEKLNSFEAYLIELKRKTNDQ